MLASHHAFIRASRYSALWHSLPKPEVIAVEQDGHAIPWTASPRTRPQGRVATHPLAGSGPRLREPSDSISGQGWQGDYIKCSPSQSQPRCTRGMTLIGWPGLGDGYCHVERRRSWTWIKLMRQRAGGRAPPDRSRGCRSPGDPVITLAGIRPEQGAPVTPPRKPCSGHGTLWGEHRRRVIPAGLETRTGVSRPGAHTVGAPGCAGAHPNPRGPKARHLNDCTTVRAGECRLCGLNQPPRGIGVASGTGTQAARATARRLAPTGGRARVTALRTTRRAGPEEDTALRVGTDR